MAAAEGSSARSSSAADSYIGSLISLTSKSEIRYEGVLYNINTDESSIGLRNVRSFGTEGRKKDGPQVPPSDKVYDYILFRGSDIKDLQVKSSPPAEPTPSINNDPAIIQSHYPRPAPSSTAVPSAASVPTADVGSHASQMGPAAPNFQTGLPLYQPGSSMGPWGASPLPPPTANPGGLAMPMYWPGYYGAQTGIPQMHQQPLLRPPSGLSMPPFQQPIQHPSFNATLPAGAPNLPDTSNSLLMMSSSLLPMTSTTLPSTTLPTAPSYPVTPEILSSSLSSSKAPIFALPSATAAATLNMGIAKDNKTVLPLEPVPPAGPLSETVNSLAAENPRPTPTPSLVTPGQLLQTGPTNISSSQFSQIAQKDVEVVQVSSSPPTAEPSAPVAEEAQPPILPLPPPARTGNRQNGAPYQNRYGYRGRGRGRGSWSSHPVSNYSEDFDFTAMNEKFNKDEVWGHLGKNNRTQSRDEAEANVSDEEEFHDEVGVEASQIEVKPVYNKDDFFDSLSSNSMDRNSRGGRTRFSERFKVDTETFGDFQRYRGGRGPGYGGGFRGRGNYSGRGYGYNRRGRGRDVYTSAS